MIDQAPSAHARALREAFCPSQAAVADGGGAFIGFRMEVAGCSGAGQAGGRGADGCLATGLVAFNRGGLGA